MRGWRLPTRLLLDEHVTFGARLILSVVAVLALVGVIGYFAMSHELRSAQIANYAATQRSDAATFEGLAAAAGTRALAVYEIDKVLDAVARRPGTLETLLIDQRNVIRASGDDHLVGTRDADPRIDAALQRGQSYAGHESASVGDPRDFEFVSPVTVLGHKYAYKVTYDHVAFDAELSRLRRVLILLGLLAAVVGGAVFYLVGGRPLMRNHRLALERATRDGLTDLPNQRAFHDEFPQAVATAQRYQEPLALVLMDVDDFKLLNDRHGHQHGDAVLARVATVLNDGRAGDRVYRIGGDEFATILPHTDSEGVRIFARRLQRSMSESRLNVSIGVSALRPGEQADVLHAEADAALYEAKRRGDDRTAHFDDIRKDVVVVSAAKREAVRRLIDTSDVTMAFQPIWDLTGGTLLGLEALARPGAASGLAGPAEMFDVAEQIGRVHELDELCVGKALEILHLLPDDALLFVNVCPQTLDLDDDENDWVRAAVDRAGVPTERVVIEVTERFGGRVPSITKSINRLHSQGFKIALDDVGTGNSGLELLRRIATDFVKIDGSIVTSAPTEPGARAVLMAMATFARQTGAFVIAEGIEDEETLGFLRDLDTLDPHPRKIIQGGQGYNLGRPMPGVETRTLVPLPGIPVVESAANQLP